MPVKTQDQLRSELDATIFTNPGGEITPATVHALLLDMIDSAGTGGGPNYALGTGVAVGIGSASASALALFSAAGTAVGIGSAAGITGTSPVFTSDFTALSLLPAGISFSRASNAMVTDSAGNLTYAPNNLLLQSNNFSDTAWGVSTCTVASGVSDPDGGTTASTLTATANGAIFYQQVASDGNFVSSIRIRRRTGTGTVSLRTPDNSNTTPISVTGSWQRLFVSGAAAGGPVYTFAIVLATSGDAVDIYQAQGERVTYETSHRTYNPTTSAVYYGPRFDFAWNGSAWVAKGLLDEEQRTNLIFSSQLIGGTSWNLFGGVSATTNAVVAPDGTTAGSTVTFSTGVSDQVYQTGFGGLPQDVTHTFSVWAKSSTGHKFRLKIADTADRLSPDVTTTSVWQRFTFTYTPTGSSAGVIGIFTDSGNNAGSVDVWGAQIEAGAFSTSHIPTTTAAVTRSADIPSASSPLTGYLAAGPSVWEFQDEATGTITRTAYAAGAFDWPVNKWYRSMGVYASGTDTSSHMTVGSAY